MMARGRTRLFALLASVALCAGALGVARAQTRKTTARRRAAMSRSRKGQAKPAPAVAATPTPRGLTEGEKKLVEGSRAAIIETGISEAYFAEHFRLAKVVDAVDSRAVEWKYAVGDYETSLSDAVGYYTGARGERVNVHGVKGALVKAHDITRTLPKARALQILRGCIGRHGDTSIVYRSLELNSPARLYLTARELKEGRDPIRELGGGRRIRRGEEEEEIALFNVGFVDLESGQCRVVTGQVTG
jgi:hypothetical protein